MHKPTPLEVLLEHSQQIPIFKGIGRRNICELTNRVSLTNINKDEFAIKECTTSTDVVSIVLYGFFTISIDGNKVGVLKEGDMFGIGNILYEDDLHIVETTVQASSYKNLLLSFRIKNKYIEPCAMSAKLYQNMAIYFANKLNAENRRFCSKVKKGKQ